jgi:uncharacterized protein (TIGR00369 family)
MQIDTHAKIDRELCGCALEVGGGRSRVELKTTPRMVADGSGLVHGGFVFGLADYAAMIAVNHPNVVLGAAEVRFLKPVISGETLVAEAKTESVAGKRHHVNVSVARAEEVVFSGTFTCYALDTHVLG